MKRVISLCALISAISGCDRITDKIADRTQKSSIQLEFSADLSSPDNSLKSWWRYLDAIDRKTFENCNKYLGYQDLREEYFSTFTTGEVLSVKSSYFKKCTLNTYSRVIKEVKQETETRAVALATIKNTTSSSLMPTEDEKIDRETGSIYRYLLEKDEEGWKISEVAKYSTYSFDQNDPWKSEYKRYPESYPARTYTTQ